MYKGVFLGKMEQVCQTK